MSDAPRLTVSNCIRCSAPTHLDPEGDTGCYMCGWRDYREAQRVALEEEAKHMAEADAWQAAEGSTETRTSKRRSRRRNR